MLESLKKLTRHSAVYGIGHIVTRSVGFLLLPLYTNFLDPTALGIAAIVFLYLAIMTILYTYGIDSAFLRYYILAEQAEEQKRLFSTAFLSVFFTSIVFSLVGYLFAADLADIILIGNVEKFLNDASDPQALEAALGEAAFYFQLSSGILFFDALAILPFLVLRAKEKSKQFVLLKMLNVVVNLGLNVVFLAGMHLGIAGIFWANLISSGFTLLTILPIILANLKLYYGLRELRSLLAFGLPYIPSTLAVVLMDLIDRFILKALKGYEILGIYHANYKLAMIMSLLVAAFRFAWHPFFLSTSKQAEAKAIFAKVLTYFMLVCTGVYLFIAFFLPDLVRIRIGPIYLIGKEYWAGLDVVPIVMLAYIFYGAYLNFLVGIHLEKKTGYLPFITGLGLAVNIAGNYWLIPRFSLYGAAMATVISYAVMTIALYRVGQRLYRVEYEFRRLFKLGFWLIFYIFLYYAFDLSFFWRVLLILLFPGLLFISRFFETREMEYLRSRLL